MAKAKLIIKLTDHAKQKSLQRKISLKEIRKVVEKSDWQEPDKHDSTLEHMIGITNKKYLRVIGRWVNKNTLVVISVFFDRRIKGRQK